MPNRTVLIKGGSSRPEVDDAPRSPSSLSRATNRKRSSQRPDWPGADTRAPVSQPARPPAVRQGRIVTADIEGVVYLVSVAQRAVLAELNLDPPRR
jgi:hypothetical protein